MKKKDPKERRRHTRIPAKVRVDMVSQANNRIISAETEDISVGGARLHSEEQIHKEREYLLYFYLSNIADDPMALHARIAHIRNAHQVGVQFTDVDPPVKKAIWQYMLHQTKENIRS